MEFRRWGKGISQKTRGFRQGGLVIAALLVIEVCWVLLLFVVCEIVECLNNVF